MAFARKNHPWIIVLCFVVLTLLWLPGLRYPVVSDTAIYAELGENLWSYGSYSAMGAPSARHPPLYAFYSYPFVAVGGIHLGMKLATLFAGFGVLLASYFLLRRSFGSDIAIISVVILTFHHAFVLMTHLGSADLLFAALFIAALAAYVEAQKNKKWYLLAGTFAGLACITRYNGVPLVPLFLLYTFWARRRDFFQYPFLTGIAISILPLALWFLRNFLVFGNAFHSDFTAELDRNSAGTVAQLVSNIVFYINPLHNVLPILFVAALYGIARHGRRQNFLIFGMLSAWVLTSVWWVQAMRFAFPGYPILLGFGVAGLLDIWQKFPIKTQTITRKSIIIISLGLIIFTHLPLLCFYAYGQCNAFVDRFHIPGVSRNLGLTPEGFYSWSLMRDELITIAPQRSTVFVENEINERAWEKGVFRSDMRVTKDRYSGDCPLYHIAQRPDPDELVISKTEDAPVTYLTIIACPKK